MNLKNIRTLALLILLLSSVASGCASSGMTQLCGNFQSYQTLDNVRAEIARRGGNSEWTERSQGTSPTDRRPPYKLTALSGEFKLYGISGNLRLTFYNGQLMEAQFTPHNGDEFMKALRLEMPKAPQRPAEEIVIYRRTHFRFDGTANSNFSFTWYDPKLENEWKKWVATNG